LKANQPVSFFIKLEYFRVLPLVESLTLENSQTQEQLVIKQETQRLGSGPVSISRYPMETNQEEWIKEMEQRPNTDNRKIEFSEYSD
jgi:hypothetical protein